ncbi:Imm71 family immunity protein [Pseudoduganella sp. LjRoot289]|uniref:Imm71 family immunity protein n=1 Tax=Pseudoduganella sp. LjRoot289 TaxID=3342314 RepID=UPI003ECC69EB
MNQSIPSDAVKLPSGLERQQIFYWLKRVSSVTAWRRIFEYYKAWAAATENSLREADEHGWGDETSLPQSEYVLILKCLAHCEEGVIRLMKGDKRVFKFDANGEFVMAQRILSHWSEMLYRIEIGENGIKKNTPRWAEFCETLMSTGSAWGECGPHILEPRYLGEAGRTVYGQWIQKELSTMSFPSELAMVPDPVENTFVRTNGYTPCSGIWEPVDVPKSSFLSLLTGAPKPQPPFKIAGAMNYLHGGSKAPRITVETATDNIDLDTTWRLLWRDDRYNDGTVPEEEAHYHFTKPDLVPPPPPPIWVPEELVWAESGTAAPLAGKWLVASDLNASVMLNIGEELPLHNRREVRWVLARN